MSFLHYLTTRRNLTSSDCYTKEQYLVFLSWTQYVALPLVRSCCLSHEPVHAPKQGEHRCGEHRKQRRLCATDQRIPQAHD